MLLPRSARVSSYGPASLYDLVVMGGVSLLQSEHSGRYTVVLLVRAAAVAYVVLCRALLAEMETTAALSCAGMGRRARRGERSVCAATLHTSGRGEGCTAAP